MRVPYPNTELRGALLMSTSDPGRSCGLMVPGSCHAGARDTRWKWGSFSSSKRAAFHFPGEAASAPPQLCAWPGWTPASGCGGSGVLRPSFWSQREGVSGVGDPPGSQALLSRALYLLFLWTEPPLLVSTWENVWRKTRTLGFRVT